MRPIIFPAILLIGALLQLGSSQLLYQWDHIQFKDLPRPENFEIDGKPYYKKENVFMTGIAYDSVSKFMCAAFPALKSSSPVTIGCFDTKKYPKGSSPVFKPFPSYRDNDLPGWPSVATISARSDTTNYTNAFSQEDEEEEEEDQLSVTDLQVSHETERVLSHVAHKLGSSGQKVIIVYNKPRRHRRPRPPLQHSDEEETEGEEGEEEELPVPPPPPKKTRPPPREEYDSYSDEYNYRPPKRPEAPQVIVVQDKNTNMKAAVLKFLSKVGHKLNPLNVFGLNKKDDVVVYLDRPHQRPRPKPRTTTTTTTTPVPPVGPADATTTTTTTSSITSDPELQDQPINYIKMTPPPPATSEYLPPVRESSTIRPAFLIRRPLYQQNNQMFSEEQSFESLRSLSPPPETDRGSKVPSTPRKPYNFISIHRPMFDGCGRLWFIDTGSLEYDPKPVLYKEPTLWAFKVRRNTTSGELDSSLYLRYKLRGSSYRGLRSLVVDIHTDCHFFHVYIPNQVDNKIVVYSSRKQTHWFFEHPVLKAVVSEPAPLPGGQGVSALSLGKKDRHGFRPVFITIASSLAQYKVSSRLLRDSSSSPDEFDFLRFHVLGYKKTGDYTTATAFDFTSNVLFMTTFPKTTFNCWNSRKYLNPDSVGTLFTNSLPLNGRDVQVDREGNVLFLTNNVDTFTNSMALGTGANFQVYKFDTLELVKGSICDPSKRDYRSLDFVTDVEENDEEGVEKVDEEEEDDGAKKEDTNKSLLAKEILPEEEENVNDKEGSLIKVEIKEE